MLLCILPDGVTCNSGLSSPEVITTAQTDAETVNNKKLTAAEFTRDFRSCEKNKKKHYAARTTSEDNTDYVTDFVVFIRSLFTYANTDGSSSMFSWVMYPQWSSQMGPRINDQQH
jgi:hypothetical protein